MAGGIGGVIAVVAGSDDKDIAGPHNLCNGLGQVVLAVMRAIRCADAHADNVGLAHTVGVAVDITDTIGDLDGRQAGAHLTDGTQHDIGPGSHAAIAAHMGTGGNAGCVGAVGGRFVIGGQPQYLVVEEYRAREDRLLVPRGMAALVARVIHPDDAATRGVLSATECQMPIIKAHIDNADNDPATVVVVRHVVGQAVHHIDDMGSPHGAVGAQRQAGTDLDIFHPGKGGNLFKLADGHLGCDEAVKLAADNHSGLLQVGYGTGIIHGNEAINHFLSVNHV